MPSAPSPPDPASPARGAAPAQPGAAGPGAWPWALFASGALCGLLGALLAREWQRGNEPDVARYALVRELVLETYHRELSAQELLDGALRGMVDELDPFSSYATGADMARAERESIGTYVGIGVRLHRGPPEPQVLYALADSPAARAGVRPGDRIRGIDGRPAEEYDRAALEARFCLAEPLELELEDLAGARRNVRFEPGAVPEASVHRVRRLDDERAIGYASIASFTRRTPEELDEALERLSRDGLRGLVLDLRGNGGGVLESAVRIANRFLGSGVIVRTERRGRQASEQVARSDEARWLGLPLVVLVDRASASASEVLAGALQDHRAAVIVGEPTYGKGAVQTLTEIGRHEGLLRLTTAHYRTPAGRMFSRAAPRAGELPPGGLAPDVALHSSDDERRALREWLGASDPPAEALAELRAWQRDSGLELEREPPPDAVLARALELLRSAPRAAHGRGS